MYVLSLIMVSEGYPLVAVHRLSLQGLLSWCRAQASVVQLQLAGCRMWAQQLWRIGSVALQHVRSNRDQICPLHWSADSEPLDCREAQPCSALFDFSQHAFTHSFYWFRLSDSAFTVERWVLVCEPVSKSH